MRDEFKARLGKLVAYLKTLPRDLQGEAFTVTGGVLLNIGARLEDETKNESKLA
jgi:hypothetical protein